MTFTPARPTHLIVDRRTLQDTIELAFVESRYAFPPRPWLVDVFHDGTVVLTDPAMPPLHGILPVISVACNGAPDMPANSVAVDGAWSPQEFREWISSRNDLYLTPMLDELYLRAHALGIDLVLTDR